MRFRAKTTALERLQKLKADFAETVRSKYEHKAKDCATCETKGACCMDAHFVNVHITRLEAEAIAGKLAELEENHRQNVYRRMDAAIESFSLSENGDTFAQTFACPLFEPVRGCLVHSAGKPLPCIHHACYENAADLPPDELLDEQAAAVERLNRSCYAGTVRWLPLPVAVKKVSGDRG